MREPNALISTDALARDLRRGSLPAGAIAGWALHPLEKRRLVTAHVDSGHSRRIRGSRARRSLRNTEVARFALDSLLEEAGFELVVPRDTAKPRPPFFH
jgi:hypothetical protein